MDFAHLAQEHGPPPQVVWVACGNTTNAKLQQILAVAFPEVRAMLEAGGGLVEIGDAPPGHGRTLCHIKANSFVPNNPLGAEPR